MLRTEFVDHLYNQDCEPLGEYDAPGVSELWRNTINGEEAYVPYVEDLTTPTWCTIVKELRIDPPLQFDADYHVFISFMTEKIEEGVFPKPDEGE